MQEKILSLSWDHVRNILDGLQFVAENKIVNDWPEEDQRAFDDAYAKLMAIEAEFNREARVANEA